jgi:hypothetical protein
MRIILAACAICVLAACTDPGTDPSVPPSTPTFQWVIPEGATAALLSIANAPGATALYVQRATQLDFSDATTLTIDPALTWEDTGLTPSTTYRYRVMAHNAAGDSDFSDTLPVMTTAEGTDPMSDYALASSSRTNTTISLTWSTPPSAGFLYCDVYRQTGATGEATKITAAPITATSYTDTALQPSTTYAYRIVARDGSSGCCTGSLLVSVTTKAYAFAPLTASLSIATGTYALGAVSYTFFDDGTLDMSAGGNTLSGLAYTYNGSNGDLTFSDGVSTDYTYHNVFTITTNGTTYLAMPGYRKTSGDASGLEGTYEFGMSVTSGGSTTETTMTMSFNADGTFSMTVKITGNKDVTSNGTWDTSAGQVAGYSFASSGGLLFLFAPAACYTQQ